LREELLTGQFSRPNVTGDRGLRLYAVKEEEEEEDNHDDDTPAPAQLQRIVNDGGLFEVLAAFCDLYEPGATLTILAEETDIHSQDRPPSASASQPRPVPGQHSALRIGVPVSEAMAVRGILHNALLPSGANSAHRKSSSASSSSSSSSGGGQQKKRAPTAEGGTLAGLKGNKKPRSDIKTLKQRLEFLVDKAATTLTPSGVLNAKLGGGVL